MHAVMFNPLCAGVFRHLEWDCDEHSIVMKSTHCKLQRGNTGQVQHNSGQARHSNGSHSQPALMALVVMSVWPLQFTGLIEIHKKVIIFLR